MDRPLKILIVATKSPWPPVDGGRVVVLETLRALSGAGHDVTLVAPVAAAVEAAEMRAALAGCCTPELVPAQPRTARAVMATSMLRGRPVTVVRHELAAVRRRVGELLGGGGFDVVQAEQLQALAQCEPAVRRGVPLVYRAHNVESALWAYAGTFGRPLTTALLRREGRRLASWEARALRRVSAAVALTEIDLPPLRAAAPDRCPVEVVPVPFPAVLPQGRRALAGHPAVVTLASSTWMPSRETARHIAEVWWPEVRHRLPRAILHIFGGVPGGQCDGVQWHDAPTDSADAFPPGAVLAIPTRHPTGVPVKALESWARRLPVVASAETATALATSDGRGIAVADSAPALVSSLVRIEEDPEYVQSLVDGGRQLLASRHAPSRIAASLAGIYRGLCSES